MCVCVCLSVYIYVYGMVFTTEGFFEAAIKVGVIYIDTDIKEHCSNFGNTFRLFLAYQPINCTRTPAKHCFNTDDRYINKFSADI